jgi:nucleolar MIF4G domain-containing protein 1
VSRKDKRKQEREAKKQRKGQKNEINRHKPATKKSEPKKEQKPKRKLAPKDGPEDEKVSDFGGFSDENLGDSSDYEDFDEDPPSNVHDDALDSSDFDEDDEDQPQTAEDTMAALMALKKKKQLSEPKTADDTMAALKALKGKKGKKDEELQTVEQTMAALKGLKEKKKKPRELQTAEETMAALKAAKSANKESKEFKKASKKESKKNGSTRYLTPDEERLLKRDEDDMKYYAKKLGLKSTKISEFKNKKDDDGLGDLLDGLDFLDAYGDSGDEEKYQNYDLSQEDDEEEEEELNEVTEEEEEEEEEEDDKGSETDEEDIIENPFSSDDDINSSDFDSDIDPEAEDEEDEGNLIMARPKENPYAPAIAPATTTKYIPPALRAKLNGDSEQLIKIKRSVKGPLNRLSEANVITIVNDINSVYLDNPRQLVTECLTSVILESIMQQSVLLDTFVTLHGALVSAVYRSQGVEVGAYFIQTLVEQYEQNYSAGNTKEAGNLVTLLTSCYSFQLVSCKLLYNLISELINESSEMNSEILLRIVRNSGQQMRSDDPNALKEIILQVQKNAQGKEINSRTRFLVETITNLKNNKTKMQNEATSQLITRMRKLLANVTNKPNEPLQVTLDDIHSIETKGKWWLVGSAWKGNDAPKEVEVNEEELNDILDSAEPNWMELARAQRMNTDIRRAIFISIMSSGDYIEAFTKLDKLRLKRSQEREIPKILLHCVSIEKLYNPYYCLLANKLCSSHSMRKTLQFCFWDLIHELEGDEEDEGDYFKRLNHDMNDEDEDFQMQRLVNQGKFFGVLMADGPLPLHSLKSINFLSLNSDTSLLLEVLMISFFDNLGKKSEVAAFGSGMKKSRAEDLKFQDTLLIERLAKCQTQKVLLRGLQYFLQEKVRGSDIINGRKQRKRVEWGVDSTCDICDEFLKQGN